MVIAWCVVQSIAAPVAFGQTFLLIPPVMLITMLPISIAGWGVREATMGLAFGYAGLMTNEGINVSLLYGAVSFIVGAIGGLVWIFSAEKAAKEDTEPIEAAGMTACSGPMMARHGGWCFWRRVAAAIVSAGLIKMIRPYLLKHALAKPNARSSHLIPTPQGAGIAVIAATLAAAGVACLPARFEFPGSCFSAPPLFIAVVGFADDIRPIPVLPRLLLQAIAVGAIVLASSLRSSHRAVHPGLDRTRPARARRASGSSTSSTSWTASTG